jgi:hypothetical protein
MRVDDFSSFPRKRFVFARREEKKKAFRPKDSADAHVFFRFSGSLSLCNRFL